MQRVLRNNMGYIVFVYECVFQQQNCPACPHSFFTNNDYSAASAGTPVLSQGPGGSSTCSPGHTYTSSVLDVGAVAAWGEVTGFFNSQGFVDRQGEWDYGAGAGLL